MLRSSEKRARWIKELRQAHVTLESQLEPQLQQVREKRMDELEYAQKRGYRLSEIRGDTIGDFRQLHHAITEKIDAFEMDPTPIQLAEIHDAVSNLRARLHRYGIYDQKEYAASLLRLQLQIFEEVKKIPRVKRIKRFWKSIPPKQLCIFEEDLEAMSKQSRLQENPHGVFDPEYSGVPS